MRYFFLFFLLLSTCLCAHAQKTDTLAYTLRRLDSIKNSATIARHFGGLYVEFLEKIETRLQCKDSANKALVRRFEAVFAHYFIDASAAYTARSPIPTDEWEAYFSDTTLDLFQYKLLGANAHLNGELWKALTASFTTQEMEQVHDEFAIFKQTMDAMYHEIYMEARAGYGKIMVLHIITLGADEWVGKMYLHKWVGRQIRLAELKRANSPRFTSLYNKTHRKKQKVDKLIIKMPL